MSTATIEKPKSLAEAKKRLAQMGIKPAAMPNTLGKALDLLHDLDSGSTTMSPKLAPQPQNRQADSVAKAKQFLAAHAPTKAAADPEDMTREQLEAAVEAEKDPRKSKDLFLRGR